MAAAVLGAGRRQLLVARRFQQPALRQRGEHPVEHAGHFLLAPAQRELGGDVRIDAAREALDVGGAAARRWR